MNTILRLYDNVAALRSMDSQLDEEQGGWSKILKLIAHDIEACGEELEAAEVRERIPACGVAMSEGLCAVVKIGKDGDIKADIFRDKASGEDCDGEDVDENESGNTPLN